MAREPEWRRPDTPIDPDRVDVEHAQRGDMVAFERLYRRHFARVNSLAQWMLGRTDTDDVVQEILTRVWYKLETFRGDATFKTWLHQVAVNVLLRHREKLARHEARNVYDSPAMHTTPSRDDRLELFTEVESALMQLPPRLREVLALHDAEGYTHAEIAEMLGIAVGTSKFHLHAARARFREHFD